jgi:uncharacterized protein
MLKLTTSGLLAALALAAPAGAQPSFDCAQADGQIETLICKDPALAALDVRLSGTFAKAVDTVRGLDAGRGKAEQDLRATQRGWIKGRDNCWKASDVQDCVTASYLTREAELVALWMLQDPQAVQSYTCDGAPAHEITVFFFDTELPAIRAEYGDSIRTGWRVPAASGSKYAMASGSTFWVKGKQAQLDWTEGDALSCTATE